MKNRTIIKFLLILILLLLPLYAKADIAINSSNFPDDKFKTLLINCDTNTDGKLSDEEIAAINEIATSDEIYDLTGIEYLTELGSLTLWNSRLTALDLSKNTKLTSLRIDESSITEIDFSSNPNLTNLVLGWNHSLSKINIRKNVKLTHLSVFYSNISELDVSKNTALTYLMCDGNNLTKLDVSHNTSLLYLHCYRNNIEALDLSNCPSLCNLVKVYERTDYSNYYSSHISLWGDYFSSSIAVDPKTIVIAGDIISSTIESGDDLSLYNVNLSKTKATVNQKITIDAVTSTQAEKLNMYTNGEKVSSWKKGYTDKNGIRVWKVTYAFADIGKRTIDFKAENTNGEVTAAKRATITITKAPTLSSVKFTKAQATAKQNVTISAVTNTLATKLTMYSGSKAIKSWTSGYTDKDGKRTWKVTYAFDGAGERTMSFKAADANGAMTEAKSANITITKAPTLSNVKFAKATATVKQKVTIAAVTNTLATKLMMYSGNKAVKSWTSGYTDSGTKRTWKVNYVFDGAGERTLDFKAADANGALTAAKSAAITVTKAPKLSSVKFAKTQATVKQNVTITAVTNTLATKLTMYSGSKAIKSWTSGYTDKDGKRTWKVKYAFEGAGERTVDFKAADENGVLTEAKSASVTITKAPKLSSVKFSTDIARVNEEIEITAVTSINTTKLTMYLGEKAVKSWTEGYEDKDGKRTWKVKYSFAGKGERTLDFKGFDANGVTTDTKTAAITVTK